MIKSTPYALLIAALLLWSGCSLLGGFAPPQVVKHPDAPMLITQSKGAYIKTAVYDAQHNQLIEYGWIKTTDPRLEGWTIMKFDWEHFMESKRGPDKQ